MYSVDKALDILVSKKVVNNKQYWLDNYSKLQNVDNLIIQMANYIEPYKEVVPPAPTTTPKIEYYETPNKTRILCSDVSNLKIGIAKDGISNSKLPNNSINGTFFHYGYDDKTKKTIYYSTSLLYLDHNGIKGVQGSWTANHYPYKQSCLIKYKDGSITMKQVLNIAEIQSELSKIEWLIGGVGLYGNGKLLRYEDEGFIGVFSDIARKAPKSLIGVNSKTNKIYLVTRENIANRDKKYDLEDLALDLVADYSIDYILQLDSGGSTSMRKDDKNIISTGRKIHSYLYFD